MKSKFFWHIAIIKRVKTVTFDQIKKNSPGSWFSEYSKGFQIDYNVTDPQFKFLRIFSQKKRKHAAP